MNVSIYIFGEFTAGYSQYPSDYTTDIFQKFYKQSKAQTQLCIHRDGDIMYYAYIRKLADERYIGLCAVVNDLMLSNISSLFSLFERLISGMINRSELIMLDELGNISTNVTQLYLERETIEKLRHTLRLQLDRQPTQELPTMSFSISRDSVKDFVIHDNAKDIIDASTKYGYTYIYKDTDYESVETDRHKAIISKLAKEKEELQRRCDDLTEQLEAERLKIAEMEKKQKKSGGCIMTFLKWFFITILALVVGYILFLAALFM